MDERAARRLGGFAGITFVVLLLVPFLMLGAPPAPDDPLPDITKFLVDKHDTLRISLLLVSLGLTAFLVFLGVVVALIRSREGVFSPYSSITALTGVVTIVGILVSLSAFYAAGYRAGPDGVQPAVRALFDFSNHLGTAVNAVGAVGIAAPALAVRRLGVLPRWAATVGLAAAALTLFGVLGMLGDKGAFAPGGIVGGLLPVVAVFVWVLSWAIALLRSDDRVTAA
jgi:hypothetical protein